MAALGYSASRSALDDDLLAPLSEEENERLARTFERSRGVDGFVDAEEGRRQLQRTGLQEHQLSTIWDLSDLDRDRRLSLREFTCAMHLAEQVRNGRPLPVEVRPEHQEAMVQGVERLLQGSSLPSRSVPERTKLRHEEFSTVDTTASGHGRGRRMNGGMFDSEHSFTNGFSGEHGADGFDSPGGLGSRARGRDPAPRSQGLPASTAGLDGFHTATSQSGAHGREHELQRKLGQLASVFDVVARLDSGGELRRLANEVLDERKELERQLSRRRELEEQLREARGRLDEVREQRRTIEAESAASKRRVTHLQDELVFVNREVKGVEEDLDALRQACGLGVEGGSRHGKECRRGPAPYSNPEEERRDVLSKVRAERELLLKDQRAIEELRSRLDQIFKQKLEAQTHQQALLEKQRQSEQDRGLMLTAIEADRAKLSAMRAERLRLAEERSALERDLQDVSQEQWLASSQVPPHVPGRSAPAHTGSKVEQPRTTQRSRSSKGVPQDETPAVVYGGAQPMHSATLYQPHQLPMTSPHQLSGPGAALHAPQHWTEPSMVGRSLAAGQGGSAGALAGGYPKRDGRGVRADA
eukprot:gb/GFBE01028601.1/.p1 GENE.gb/GFBE01028601.1/~~gb/GFBE01028601.1/.p1  ORF type:complete len:585 (+),score=115.21 gb/GFBE01028601.1/:1-1755(+)